MSNALKCDRCNTCFDPLSVLGERYFTYISGIRCKTSAQYQENTAGYSKTDLHLCPACSKMFIKFLNNEDLIERDILDDMQREYDELDEQYEKLDEQYEKLLTDHISEMKNKIMEEIENANAEDCKNVVYRTVYRLLYASEPDDQSGGSNGTGEGNHAAAKRTKRTEKKRKP